MMHLPLRETEREGGEYEFSGRIGGESRLSGSAKAEEDRHISVVSCTVNRTAHARTHTQIYIFCPSDEKR
jgi:hypothetical protein